jgi:CheY-like chemotaxis protein
MDHMMPEMDGVEATRIIRLELDTEYARTVPIIAFTANALYGNEEMFLSNGFNGFISKPIDILRLDMALNQWVRDRHSETTHRPANDEAGILAQENNTETSGVFSGLHVEGVDFESGIARYGDAGAYLGILRSYATHTPKILDRLRSCSENTIQEYAIAVHSLKGISYGICADAIARNAGELERAAKVGDFKTVFANNGLLIETTENMLVNLNDVLARIASDSANDGKFERLPDPDPKKLERMLDGARRIKTSMMEETLRDLEQFRYESDAGQELVVWLREKLDNLEYHAIRDRLEKLIQSPTREP